MGYILRRWGHDELRNSMMKHMPPTCVQRVCDPRWHRFIVLDALGQYWTGRGWSLEPSEAMLFYDEHDANQASDRLNNLTAEED